MLHLHPLEAPVRPAQDQIVVPVLPLRWEEREVNERLRRIMRKAFSEVSERAKDDQVSLRTAAFELGIERVLEAARTRGYIG